MSYSRQRRMPWTMPPGISLKSIYRGPSTKLAWKGSYRKSSKTYLRNYLKIYKKKKGRLEREKK